MRIYEIDDWRILFNGDDWPSAFNHLPCQAITWTDNLQPLQCYRCKKQMSDDIKILLTIATGKDIFDV